MSFTVVFHDKKSALEACLPVALDLSSYEASLTHFFCDSTKINPILVYADFVEQTTLNSKTIPLLDVWCKATSHCNNNFKPVAPGIYSELSLSLINKQFAPITSLKNVFAVVVFRKKGDKY